MVHSDRTVKHLLVFFSKVVRRRGSTWKEGKKRKVAQLPALAELLMK